MSDPMDCSTSGFPVHRQLPALAQMHIHLVGEAIQPSHPLSSPSPPVFNLSQHQGLFLHVGWPKNWNFSFSISPSSGPRLRVCVYPNYNGPWSQQPSTASGGRYSPWVILHDTSVTAIVGSDSVAWYLLK